jgi:restriction system protein
MGPSKRFSAALVCATQAGADGGVDLILTKNGERTFVQCKQWKSWKVGVETIRALYGVAAKHGAVGGIVVCSGHYTQAARKFAQGVPIQLIDVPRFSE